MIVKDSEAAKRLSSPMNLINRLSTTNGNGAGKKTSAMSLFGIGRKVDIKAETKEPTEVRVSFNPFKEPTPQIESSQAIIPLTESSETKLDDILENNESKIKLGLAHDKALELLNRSTEMLLTKLDDVSAAKLPAVIAAASKTVESIRKERNESAKSNKDREVHYHFYTPEQKKVSDYQVIDV